MSFGAAFFLDHDGSLYTGEERLLGEGESGIACERFDPERAASPLWKDFSEGKSWSLAFENFDFASMQPPERLSVSGSWRENREAWNELCRRAEAALAGEKLHKLVLSRYADLRLSEEECEALLSAGPALLFSAPVSNSYRFWLSRGQSVFFGATPELLFRREAGELFVPAIAGTRAIAAEAEVPHLSAELLASEKDRREHQWVVDGILASLRALGLKPNAAAEPEVLRVPRLLHLHTKIRCEDSQELSDADLVLALHPTPAICGFPKKAALEFLSKEEGYDRGLFSAPLLVKLPSRTLCLVAIRSALLTPGNLRFFAGAGFVAGSTAEGEWKETGKKMQVVKSILLGDSHA